MYDVIKNDGNYPQKHPKCLSYQCNHYLDPIEFACGYFTKIDCEDCKYGMGRKNPEAKINQSL